MNFESVYANPMGRTGKRPIALHPALLLFPNEGVASRDRAHPFHDGLRFLNGSEFEIGGDTGVIQAAGHHPTGQ